MDGVTDILDAIRILNIVANLQSPVSASDANADGSTDILDAIRVLNIVANLQTAQPRYIAGHDFNTSGAGTLDLAASKQVKDMPTLVWPADSGWANFSSGDYDDVEAIDADDFSMAANASGYNAVQCRFTVFEHDCAPDLTHIEVNVTASSQDMSETLQYWAWDFNSVRWDQVDGSIRMSGGKASYCRVTNWGPPNIADYIDDSGHMYLMVILMNKNRALNIDYIQVTLVGPEVY